MARWLCRLSQSDLERASSQASLARSLGISGWIVPVQGQSDQVFQQLAAVFRASDGLEVGLEWHIHAPLSLEQEQTCIQALMPWLRHERCLRLGSKPLLLVRGTGWLCSRRLTGSPGHRVRSQLEREGCQGALVLRADGEISNGFSGFAAQVDFQTNGPGLNRFNYEVLLHQTHWRGAAHEWFVPAVRAPDQDQLKELLNASPMKYQDWLAAESTWSDLAAPSAEQSVVVIDSWAGHQAWWEEIKQGQEGDVAVSLPHPLRELAWGVMDASHTALMVHGYHLDGLDRMLRRVADSQQHLDLYISTPIAQLHATAARLRELGWSRVRLFGVPNRGRDMAPFVLQLLPAALAAGHQAFIKLHTKASLHLVDGHDWGRHLIDSLLSQNLLTEISDRLARDPSLGLMAPAGSLLPITVMLKDNGAHLGVMQRRFGVHADDLLSTYFVAGSMFAGRLSCLAPLLQLGLTLAAFEPESGQTDGTLAHAIERWIGVIVHQQGFCCESLPGDPLSTPGFGYRDATHPEPVLIDRSTSEIPNGELLPGFPRIESPIFHSLQAQGVFGRHHACANQLRNEGFALINLGRDRMAKMAALIRTDLEPCFDLGPWREQSTNQDLRLQDAHFSSPAVRQLAELPEILEVLSLCWGRQAFPFQTLNFPVGTQQHVHSDAVHFQSDPPGFMCGVWVPLEDVDEHAGPLFYYPGSHRLPYLQARDVGYVQVAGRVPDQSIFHAAWKALIEEHDLKMRTYTPQLGHALIWSANLLHGGSAVLDRRLTRWSQVTHYFFRDCRHYTPLLSDWPVGKISWRNYNQFSQGQASS